MKFTLILVSATAAFAGLVERNTPGCDSDNCARAVTGTRLGLASVSAHRSDCSSFMAITSTIGGAAVTPTHTPAYASACTAPGDSYSSACSCWGIPTTTILVHAPLYDDNGADDLAYGKKE